MATSKMNFRVSLHGSRIKARLRGKLFCSRMGVELPNTFTYSRQDGFWSQLFGSRKAVENFIRVGRPVSVTAQNPFDPCDRAI